MTETTNDVEKGGICMLLVGIQFSRAVIENSMKAPQKPTDQTNKKTENRSAMLSRHFIIESICTANEISMSIIFTYISWCTSHNIGDKESPKIYVYQRIKLYMCIHMHNIYTAQYCPIIKKIKSRHCDCMNGPGRLHIK